MITLASGSARTVVDLEGAWVRELIVDTQAIFFPKSELSSSTGESKTRGGMHVCLPNFGPGGGSGLDQHGFGRTSPWSVVQQNEYSVTLKLETAEPSYAGLVSVLTYRLEDDSLTARLGLSNQGSMLLRVAPGFHPYFAVDSSETAVKVNDRAYELNTLAGTEFMVADTARLRTSNRDISMTQENLTTWAIWTDKLGNYVCIEPTYGGNRFLEDEKPDELLAPGETMNYSISIKW